MKLTDHLCYYNKIWNSRHRHVDRGCCYIPVPVPKHVLKFGPHVFKHDSRSRFMFKNQDYLFFSQQDLCFRKVYFFPKFMSYIFKHIWDDGQRLKDWLMAKLYLELEVVQDIGLTRVHMVPSMLVRFISRAENLSSLLEIPHLD